MKVKAVIAISTRDLPKIKPTNTGGAEVVFDLYDVSVDDLLKLTEKELTLTIE